jgi:hypothetical protein
MVSIAATWRLAESNEFDRGSRGLVGFAILGVTLFALGAGELVHRIGHGRQGPARHVRPDRD